MPEPTPAPAPAPAPAPEPAAFDWAKQGLDAETSGYVTNKGWKGVGDLLGSYRNLEKLHGAGPERLVVLPGDDKPESWGPVYDKLGRPKEAKGYEIPMPKEGGDEGLANWFRGVAYENGLSARQAKSMIEKWNEHVGGLAKTSTEATAQKHAAEVTTLRTEWGSSFDANAKLVDRAAEAFGMKAEHVNALKTAMGPAGAMKFLHAVGSKLGVDASFVSGDSRNPGNFGGMTKEQALAGLAAKRADKAFVAKFAAGDTAARAEMDRLHQIAYAD